MLNAGMPVVGADGTGLGTLQSVLVDEETEEAGFIVVNAKDVDRLVPFEAVLDVEDGNVILDIPADTLHQLPEMKDDRDPTDAEIELAYRLAGVTDEE